MRYWLYRLRWWLGQYLPLGPIHLDLELTNRCNQSCLTCWHSGTPSFGLGQMDYYNASMWLIYGMACGYKSVKFNLRGEPLLSPYLDELVREAKKLGYVDIMINTNGVLLNKERFDSLKEAGLTTLIISVDALQPVTYEILHGVEKIDFIKLITNLYHIRMNKGKMKVVLNFHVNHFNRKEVAEFRRVWSDFKLNIRETMDREGARISSFSKTKRKRNCPHMMRRTTVLINDKMYPCCVCYSEPEDIRIFDESDRKRLIKNYRKGIYTESCKNCTSADIWKKA